ncbi:MAG: lactonase family protein [Oscillospiraceae bacterium]|jgi:6-phosphogluconolactonase|nr:lactonase family protein [Oscillospiraceae bacterium]
MSEIFYAYIGTYSSHGSEGIYRVEINGEGTARITGSYPARDASYLASNGKKLAAVFESRENSAVALYDIKPDGALTPVDEKPSGGLAPCYAAFDDANVYTANYFTGQAGVYPLVNGGLGGGQWIAHWGSGVNKSRQECSHAHCAVPIGPVVGGESYLAVCDLGTDHVWFYPRENGRVALPGYRVETPPGTGPRHMTAIDDSTWAVIGEMSCETLIYSGYADKAKLVQRLPFARTMGDPSNMAAALRLSPDGTTLLGSIRGENTLAVSRKVNGRFEAPVIVDARGNWPRDAAFTPDGRYVLAALERSHEITIFRVTDTGLEYVSKMDIPAPTCVCFPQ